MTLLEDLRRRFETRVAETGEYRPTSDSPPWVLKSVVDELLEDKPVPPFNVAPVLAWARERFKNTLRLAAGKDERDRAGWLDDAAYWSLIVVVLEDRERQARTAVHDATTVVISKATILDFAARLERHAVDVEQMEQKVIRLQQAVANQCGDNLCWVTDPCAAAVKALPEAEFLESCRRYRLQVVSEHGEATGLPTIAQLEAENARLRSELEEARNR